VFRAGWIPRSRRPRSIRQSIAGSASTYCPHIERLARPAPDIASIKFARPCNSHPSRRRPSALLLALRQRDSHTETRGLAQHWTGNYSDCKSTTEREAGIIRGPERQAQSSACMCAFNTLVFGVGRSLAAGQLLSAHGLARLLCCTVFAGFNEGLHASSMHVFLRSYWAYHSTG
jgi:hypothetical protein